MDGSVEFGLPGVGLEPGDHISALREGRFGFARVAGEAGWAIRSGSMDELIRYESALHRFTLSHPQTVLCLYDLNVLGGGIVVDMLKTHPKTMLGGMLLENPHYLTPDELLPSRS
ncbi:MAG: hypothetical protein QOK40_138 [Miltoncostaeaceae bacterium]|nr:hypothetical protein [Miltoncostaeaceae bacterium]